MFAVSILLSGTVKMCVGHSIAVPTPEPTSLGESLLPPAASHNEPKLLPHTANYWFDLEDPETQYAPLAFHCQQAGYYPLDILQLIDALENDVPPSEWFFHVSGRTLLAEKFQHALSFDSANWFDEVLDTSQC